MLNRQEEGRSEHLIQLVLVGDGLNLGLCWSGRLDDGVHGEAICLKRDGISVHCNVADHVRGNRIIGKVHHLRRGVLTRSLSVILKLNLNAYRSRQLNLVACPIDNLDIEETGVGNASCTPAKGVSHLLHVGLIGRSLIPFAIFRLKNLVHLEVGVRRHARIRAIGHRDVVQLAVTCQHVLLKRHLHDAKHREPVGGKSDVHADV